jgi:hypothetical protein
MTREQKRAWNKCMSYRPRVDQSPMFNDRSKDRLAKIIRAVEAVCRPAIDALLEKQVTAKCLPAVDAWKGGSG